MGGGWSIGAILLSVCAFARGASPPTYTLTNIGDLTGGTDNSLAIGINNVGQVVGDSNAASGRHAVLWQPTAPNAITGNLFDLGSFSDGNGNGDATDINASGQITGDAASSTHLLPYVWTPTSPNASTGSMTGLNGLPADTQSGEGYGINAYGQVTGDTSAASGPSRPFLWTPLTANANSGTATDLGDLPGGTTSTRGKGVNSSGQVAGISNVGTGVDHGFLWNPTAPNGTSGNIFDIGDLPGGASYSQGYDINDSGQIVGVSSNGSFHAFLWTPATPNGTTTGSMLDLGDLTGGSDMSMAFGIDNNGDAVGYSSAAGGNHAFLWTIASGMLDLNTLLDASGSNWTLSEAVAINDLGQIVGDGLFDSDGPGPGAAVTRGFVLTPVPEPAAGATLILSLAISLRRSRSALRRKR